MGWKIKINKGILILIISVLCLFLAPWNGLCICSLLDDLVPLFFLSVWFFWLINYGKKNSFLIEFFLLLIICLIGVLSNYIAEINTSIKDIISDMYSFLKMFFVYLGAWAYFSKSEKYVKRIIETLCFLSKIYILIGFIFGILNITGIYVMSEQVRFGLNTFSFIYGNASQYGILIGVAMAFIIFNKEKYSLVYEIMGSLIMAFTLKGMSLIILAVYWGLIISRAKKIKLRYMFFLGALLAFVLRYQINTYLLDSYAPRSILLRYGAITANRYFPFGAGFGSYGSAVAAKHYSPLYVQYGFTSRRSLIYIEGEPTALMDTYFGMVLGQFGWIATVLLIIVFASIGMKLLKIKTTDYKSKNICIAFFACICGMAVMAGSLKGAVGQLMLLTISLFIAKNETIK